MACYFHESVCLFKLEIFLFKFDHLQSSAKVTIIMPSKYQHEFTAENISVLFSTDSAKGILKLKAGWTKCISQSVCIAITLCENSTRILHYLYLFLYSINSN